MAVRIRAFLLCVVLLAVAGCSAAAGSGGAATAPPPIVLSRTPAAVKPATSCAHSTDPLSPVTDTDGVELTVSTDPSRTSLLLKNSGGLTVVVIPDEQFTTRLIAAPAADPKDAASRAALIAVNNGGSEVPGVPAYVPKNQEITLPPQWAVCALTDDLKEVAGVRYVQDQASSAEYFVAKALADQLLLKTSSQRSRATLTGCARSTVTTMKKYPALHDIQLYIAILGPRSICRTGFTALLHGDEGAAGQLGAAVLNQLGGVPRLLPDSPLLGVTAGP